MDDALTLGTNSLDVGIEKKESLIQKIKNKIAIAKEKTGSKLSKKLHEEKLKLIKEQLVADGFVFNNDIATIEELKIHLKNRLSDIDYKYAERVIEDITLKLDSLFDELMDGSTTAVRDFVNKAEKVAEKVSGTVGIPLAMRTAIALAPSITAKVALTGGLVANSAYKLIKTRKQGIALNKNNELDRILRELEITKTDGVVSDTRFSPSIQEEIRTFLKDKKIVFDDLGYISLRSAMSSLSFEDKKELCTLLNTRLGRNIDIEKRIENKSENFFEYIKDKGKDTLKMALLLIGGAAVVNGIDPAIIAGPVNGTALGAFVSNLCSNSGLLGPILGLVGGAGTAILEYIPIIGTACENLFSIENLVLAGIVGGSAGLLGSLGKDAIEKIKKWISNIRSDSNYKKLRELDNEKYGEEDKKELELMKNKLNEEKSQLENTVIKDLIYGYITDDLGINIEEPNNINELNESISKLDNKDKEKIRKFVSKLKNYNHDHNIDFINGIKDVGKVASSFAILGLAGVSIYDLIKGGTVLPGLSEKLFNANHGGTLLPEVNNIIDDPNLSISSVRDLDKAQGTYSSLLDCIREEKPTLFQNLFQGLDKVEVVDKTRISAIINELPVEDATDLAYFMNSTPTIVRGGIPDSQLENTIISALKKRLPDIINYISKNNEGIQKYRKISEILSNSALGVGVLRQGTNELSNMMDEYDNKEEISEIENKR